VCFSYERTCVHLYVSLRQRYVQVAVFDMNFTGFPLEMFLFFVCLRVGLHVVIQVGLPQQRRRTVGICSFHVCDKDLGTCATCASFMRVFIHAGIYVNGFVRARVGHLL
jgi:hypothetical protein